ncbi:MAG: leucine-rich repeat protein [Huintestinicola sp.]|uniref:leucine-rich repeat domain-containing protein n=1 Tax=Huintestinicola sp. TaxID=2981661 RepID=UPI003F0CDC25
MRKMSEQKKKNIMRIIMLVMAVVMLLSFVILPLTIEVSAEETGVSVTVTEFETGKLSEAIEKAKDGADLNTITKLAVSGGVMNASDYSAVCGYPNVEFIELAGCDTENGVIPENAMQSRNQLTYISLPANTETIGARAFSGNRKLLKISIPSTLRVIGDYAFEGCENVEEFAIPAEVTSIGTGAFSDCKALKAFSLPEAVTVIPDYCFNKCSFTEMHFGPQVEKIGEGAFSDCYSLTDVYYYGEKAPALSDSSFQNVKVTIHTYENGEGFDGLANNFVSIGYDLSEDSEYIPPKSVETQPAQTSSETESETAEAVSETETASETEAAETETSSEETAISEEAAETEAVTEAAPAAAPAGSFSGLSVLIIALLCAALAVTVTLLVVKKKK